MAENRAVTERRMSIVNIFSPIITLFGNFVHAEKIKSNRLNHLRVGKYVTQRYLAAILLVFLITIIGNTLLYNSISKQNSNSEIINVAGSQRMLLQRIAVLTKITYFEDKSVDDAQSGVLLLASLHQMETQQARLSLFLDQLRSADQEYSLLETHYFSEPVKLHEQLMQFNELVHVFVDTGSTNKVLMDKISTIANGPLLYQLDEAVKLFQIYAEDELIFTSTIVKANTAIIIILLICQILFIFRPLTNQLAKQASDLDIKAHIDNLTGLPNRQAFTARFAKIVENAQKHQDCVSLIALDLDWFKEVNHSHGHIAGDAVISEIGKRLSPLISNTMQVARLGGDEFALIFTHENGPEWAIQQTEKILQMVIQPIEFKGRPLFITATVGMANYPEDATNINELLQAAIYALRLAKETDRGTIQPFLQSQRDDIERDKVILKSLERKEDLDGLFIEFQPLINLQTQEITGCEALVRWNHPVLGRVAPDQFLKLAISHGYGAFIGEIIRGRAMEGFKELRLAGTPIHSLSINLMDVELKSLADAAELIEQINAFGLTPQDIEIEVTEDVVLDRFSGDLNRKLFDMRSAGFRLALDDFGTGFASLEHLVKLEVDVIKLDRTFVAQITKDGRSRQIISSIIKLAHKLSVKVVAEGIETSAQLEILKAFSCDIGQGYLLARPMTVPKLLLWYQDYQLANTKHLPLSRQS
ncbi:MAG: diguanylate cyclase (GGDEF)-like protein [Alphaproteobacteria bacterium]|jgi:diguanylate cyclase (GGDEF)-like protein